MALHLFFFEGGRGGRGGGCISYCQNDDLNVGCLGFGFGFVFVFFVLFVCLFVCFCFFVLFCYVLFLFGMGYLFVCFFYLNLFWGRAGDSKKAAKTTIPFPMWIQWRPAACRVRCTRSWRPPRCETPSPTGSRCSLHLAYPSGPCTVSTSGLSQQRSTVRQVPPLFPWLLNVHRLIGQVAKLPPPGRQTWHPLQLSPWIF